MLTIKSFRDGDRLVVVFEGLENLPSEEDLIKSYLTTITGAKPAEVKPVDAKAVPQIEDAPVIPKEPETFADGTYKGMRPEDVIKDKSKGFAYLAEHLNDKNLSDTMREDIKKVVQNYLKNFKDCDPVAYSKKLTYNQVVSFLNQYEAVLPGSVKKEAFKDGKLIGKEFEISLRDCVARAVKYFKTI